MAVTNLIQSVCSKFNLHGLCHILISKSNDPLDFSNRGMQFAILLLTQYINKRTKGWFKGDINCASSLALDCLQRSL